MCACVDIHKMDYYSAFKKKILPFATAWTKLENIMLSIVRQTQKGKKLHFTYIWTLKS